MKDLQDKVAVITGGGSGIGAGMARAFADAGMHVVVADVEPEAAATVAEELAARGVRSLAVPVDVTDRAAMVALADRAWSEFGAVHLVCANAGVGVFKTADQLTGADWDWVLGVNLGGVVNTVLAFVPRLKDQPGDKHLVITASMAGIMRPGGMPMLSYTTSKFGAVGLAEALSEEGAAWGLGVSVLCPGMVNTNIGNAERNRPDRDPDWQPHAPGFPDVPGVLQPDEVGRIVRRGVIDGELYILTHPDHKAAAEARCADLLAAFDRAAARNGED